MTDQRHKGSTALATIAVLAGAAGLCWMAAMATARFIEDRSMQDVSIALEAGDFGWTQVDTDGLQVQLSGTAPNEVQRFRAVTQAAAVVDQSRIVDLMQVAQLAAIEPPKFAVELLRNDEGISLIGLVPAETDRQSIIRTLQRETTAPQVTDLLEAADFATPDGWNEALDFGMQASQLARRAKVSVAPGHVKVSAITNSAAEKTRLETDLRRMKPRELVLISEISAPRPVISPFTLRFVIDADGTRFDACSADNDASRDRILEAARAAGLVGPVGCTVGLGSPSPQWADAAVKAIKAVAELGDGSVTLSDADVSLYAPASVKRDAFDATVGRLEQALPSVFSLQAELEQPAEPSNGPVEFLASVAADKTLSMRGRITDERMREAVDSFAGARFAKVESSLRTDETMPGGWTVRVIAALESMAALKNGSVKVTPDLVRITGTSGDRNASGLAASTLSQRLGPGARYELAIRYDERLDPQLGLPSGEECVAQLNTVMAESAIGFEPNKSVIAGDPSEPLARLAESMAKCADFQIEIGGHTDSQGSDAFNADLSRARAQAILTAMKGGDINTTNMTARGYGESQPVSSNETEEGREANRRIEFRLLSDVPVRSEPLPDPVVVSGVTKAAPAESADIDNADQKAGARADDEGGATAEPAPAANGSASPLAEDAQPPAGSAVQVPPGAGASKNVVGPQLPGLDAAKETARLPAQTPDDTTPRPKPRPLGDTVAPE